MYTYFSKGSASVLLFVSRFCFAFAGVIASSGSDWKDIRTFSLCTLRDFGFGKRSLQSRVKEEVEIFLQEVEKNVEQPFNPKHLLQISVSNIICSIVFGKRFEYTDQEFIQAMDDLSEEVRLGAGSAINYFPYLKHLPGDFFSVKKVLSLIDSEKRFIGKHVDTHRKDLNPNEPRDYIDAVLIAQKHNDWLTGMMIILKATY